MNGSTGLGKYVTECLDFQGRCAFLLNASVYESLKITSHYGEQYRNRIAAAENSG